MINHGSVPPREERKPWIWVLFSVDTSIIMSNSIIFLFVIILPHLPNWILLRCILFSLWNQIVGVFYYRLWLVSYRGCLLQEISYVLWKKIFYFNLTRIQNMNLYWNPKNIWKERKFHQYFARSNVCVCVCLNLLKCRYAYTMV